MVWNFLFVFVRLGSITLSVLTFWYGLALQPSTNQIDIASGNFNTQLIRINCLVAVCLLQAWMMWNFINFHLKRMRERAAQIASSKKKALAKKEKKLKKDECKCCFYHSFPNSILLTLYIYLVQGFRIDVHKTFKPYQMYDRFSNVLFSNV